MDNKGMTLATEILVIAFFAFACFFSVYILISTFTTKNKTNFELPTYYHSIEIKLENATRKYMYNKNIEEKTIITTSILRKNNLYDDKCDGYVVVDKTFYTAYIKCNDYETPGYSSILAN